MNMEQSVALCPRNYFKALRITVMKLVETFKKAKHNLLATDKDGNLVFLAETTFLLQMAEARLLGHHLPQDFTSLCWINSKLQMVTFVYAIFAFSLFMCLLLLHYNHLVNQLKKKIYI